MKYDVYAHHCPSYRTFHVIPLCLQPCCLQIWLEVAYMALHFCLMKHLSCLFLLGFICVCTVVMKLVHEQQPES